MISVIIPVYNETEVIGSCLLSLIQQTLKPNEIIVVDDGSTDNLIKSVEQQNARILSKQIKLILLSQIHQGPGKARNLGAKNARGDILVFIDADMTFDKNFLKNLTAPIISGKNAGTFTKEEFVSNWDCVWARCWNYNERLGTNQRIPQNYPNESPVFRAIRKIEFERVGGFDAIGFTDDWTLSRKLGFKATHASDAICYHKNPSSLLEVYSQARWIGKNEFLSGSFFRRWINLFRYSFPIQMLRAILLALRFHEPMLLLFIPVYSLGIQLGIVGQMKNEQKYK